MLLIIPFGNKAFCTSYFLHYNGIQQLKIGRFELGTLSLHILCFPAKIGLKMNIFLTLMGKSLIPESYSWVWTLVAHQHHGLNLE